MSETPALWVERGEVDIDGDIRVYFYLGDRSEPADWAELAPGVGRALEEALPAPTSPSEPVPSTPRVPVSTERPEGLSAEILDISRWPVTSAKRRAIRYVLTGVTLPAGPTVGGFRFDSETGALSWSQDSPGSFVTEVEETNDAD